VGQLTCLTSLLQSMIREGPPGCACQVMHNGEVIYEHYAGLADLASGQPVDAGTVYRLYSLSKVVTCVAALTFFEQGAFFMDEPVADYLPEFRHMEVIHENGDGEVQVLPARNPIRIRDLFTMTSGLTYPGDSSLASRQLGTLVFDMKRRLAEGRSYDTQSFTKALARMPLALEPGTRWCYGFSTDVLGALIEILSGSSLGQALQARIFDPLGMPDTSFKIKNDQKSRLCTLYDRSTDGRLSVNTTEDDLIQPGSLLESGGSGLLSTLGDYSRFAHMLALGGELGGTKIIGRKTVDLMTTNQLSPKQLCDFNTTRQGYGYGLGVRTMVDVVAAGSNGSAGEFGWSGLAGCWMMADRSEKLSAVYMQQMMPNMLDLHAPKLRAILYGVL
jgi:CubicO group peptidase (beta-lactamase class C family)